MTKGRRGRRKHVPMRTCIVCRQSFPKRSLVRVIVSPEQGLNVDPTGKQAGRGAYLCHESACWDKVLMSKDNSLSRALRTTVTDEDKAALKGIWEQMANTVVA